MFTSRWQSVPLPAAMWESVAAHMLTYSKRVLKLQLCTLESYLRMLAHVLIFMADRVGVGGGVDHGRVFTSIQQIVAAVGVQHPECRCRRNTKAAWDDQLVDAGMQLLLQWNVYGTCQSRCSAWPAFARLCLSLLNYTGWRPMSLTHEYLEKFCLRWAGVPVLAWEDCTLHWQGHMLLSVSINCNRLKFGCDPLYESNELGELSNRAVTTGKLTFSEGVDTCPCLAFVVWGLMNGVWGYEPLGGSGAYLAYNSAGLWQQSPNDLTVAGVEAMVAAFFAARPDRVLPEMQQAPLLCGALLGRGSDDVSTTRVSRVPLVVGMHMGLNPRKCSAVSGRKTLATAMVNHPEVLDVDNSATFGHANVRLTTQAVYADASWRNADSRALLTGQPVRQLPGSVHLAHSRNLHPDTAAAVAAGRAAARAQRARYAQHCRGVPEQQVRRYELNAYNTAFRAEMQRQFDAQARLPRCGDTAELHMTCFFTPVDCSRSTQQQFVTWQVLWGLGMV